MFEEMSVNLIEGLRFLADKDLMAKYWSYIYDIPGANDFEIDEQRAVNRIAKMHAVIVDRGPDFVSFALAVNDKSPDKNKDFFIGDFYVEPKYRSARFLYWYRDTISRSLKDLDYDTWTIALPGYEEKRVRAYSKLGFNDIIKQDDIMTIMTMEI